MQNLGNVYLCGSPFVMSRILPYIIFNKKHLDQSFHRKFDKQTRPKQLWLVWYLVSKHACVNKHFINKHFVFSRFRGRWHGDVMVHTRKASQREEVEEFQKEVVQSSSFWMMVFKQNLAVSPFLFGRICARRQCKMTKIVVFFCWANFHKPWCLLIRSPEQGRREPWLGPRTS